MEPISAFPAAVSRTAVALARLCEETRCPICFGILKQTVASTVCLHRFCANCIDTFLAGRPPQHKECPVCRSNLHSRRALRPDPNFDLLLKALYGDILLYGQQEDELVVVVNRSRAQQAAGEAEVRQAQRQAQEAAVAACRPNIHRRLSATGTAGSTASAGFARQSSNSIATAVAGPTATTAKRSREASSGRDTTAAAATGGPPESACGSPRALPPGDVLPSPSAKRHQTLARSTSCATAAVQPAAAAGGPRARSASLSGAVHPGASPPLSPRKQQQAEQRGQQTQKGHAGREAVGSPADVEGYHCGAAGAGASPRGSHSGQCGSPTSGGRGGRGPGAVGRSGPGRAAMDAHSGGGGAAAAAFAAPPRGPLSVPTARSAAELSFRHPGMVIVQLQPLHSGGGGGSGGDVLSPTSGRAMRVLAPPLEKPFLLCPAKWTVAHVAQLLSQWLPRRGYGPATAPVPPSAVHLEPATGLLRGSHRSLRGCTGLGALAAELVRGEEESGGGPGPERAGGRAGRDRGGEQQPAHLVLLYSVLPS